jgi:hypothetical protein
MVQPMNRALIPYKNCQIEGNEWGHSEAAR